MRGRLSCAAALLVALACAPAAAAQTGGYVALGDSFTAGPLIPSQTGKPLGCLRSDRNYPALAAAELRPSAFRDVSCSAATTDHMTQPQDVFLGPNPPQLDALRGDTALVTLGISGNDIGFGELAIGCLAPTPVGPSCKARLTAGGRDQVSERIAAAAPKVDAVLRGIAGRSPGARTLVVGYPVILPDSGPGCWPLVPVIPADVAYLREKEKELNAMLADRAAARDATYVDTYTSSIGHDVCRAPGVKWVEGVIPTMLAAPVHPNALGMRDMARAVVTAARR